MQQPGLGKSLNTQTSGQGVVPSHLLFLSPLVALQNDVASATTAALLARWLREEPPSEVGQRESKQFVPISKGGKLLSPYLGVDQAPV